MDWNQIKKIEGYLTQLEAECLFDLAKQAENCIVEIGSYKGLSTVVLAEGSRNGYGVPVYAIDPHIPHTDTTGSTEVLYGPHAKWAFYKNLLRYNCEKIVNVVQLPSALVSQCWYTQIGLLFIDGDHTYEGVKGDFDHWQGLVKGKIAFHDSQREGIKRAIGEAKNWKIIKEAGSLCIMERNQNA